MNPETNPQPAIGLTYGVEAKKLISAAEQAELNRKPKAWQRLNRDVMYLSVIAVLALLLLAMAGFVVMTLTNRTVNVSFRSGNSTTDQTSNTGNQTEEPGNTNQGDEAINEVETTTLASSVYLVFLASANPAFDVSNIPAGNIRVEGTTSDYLIEVPINIQVADDSNGLEELLTSLFAQQDVIYSGMVLTNPAALSGVEVTSTLVGAEYQIDLVGTISFADKAAEKLFKQQLDLVLAEIVPNFFVTVNGDELAYSRLGLN